jgi:pimeloyl-ACP methyl ester carboxylesterase
VSSRQRWIALVLITVLGWFTLAAWVPAYSERVYLLAPLFLAVAAIIQEPVGFQRLWKRKLDLLILIGATFCVSASYALQAPGIAGISGANFKRALLSGEVFIAAYFIFALVLIILGIRTVLVIGIRRLLLTSNASWKRSAAVDLLAIALLLVVAVPFAISAIFIHRFKVPNGHFPSEWAFPFEAVEFRAEDGIHLHGWFVPAKHPSPRTVIFCHGIGANSAAFLGYLPTLEKLDTNVFFVDLRGHGQSDGHTVTMGGREKNDVLAAARLVRDRWPEQSRELYGVGVSMGSSALVLAAAELEPPFDAIIVDSGFAAATDLANNVLGQFPVSIRPLVSAIGIPMASLEAGCNLRDVRPEDCIGHARGRVLIVHATGDGLIPVAQAKRMYERAHEPKRLWIIDKVQHGGVLLDPGIPQSCFDFVLGKEAKPAETDSVAR